MYYVKKIINYKIDAKKQNITEHTNINSQDITHNFSFVILQHVNAVNQVFELSYSRNVG